MVQLVVALMVAFLTVASAPVAEASASGDPVAGRPLYVDPFGAAVAVRPATPASAALAGVPQARWVTDSTPDVTADAARYVSGAAAAGATPVLVLYAIPRRDCGLYSAGGVADSAAYGAWIERVRAGIAGRPVVVILEPDAVVNADCLDGDAERTRVAQLGDAIGRLTADPATTVYVDGGHSRWLAPAELAARLRAVGVDRARGFALNVSNFLSTAEEQAYGEVVSTLLHGEHYVVDTSRNGNGPAPDGPLNWCNPEGRAVGALPTTATAAPHDDADLWIKTPGESDGDCGRGDPGSGTWFPTQAAELVANAGMPTS